MDRIQFLAWVNDPRTEAELTAQISLMGQTAPAAGSPLDDFRDVLRSHAAAQPAAWTVPAGQIPAGWTPPAAVPAAPTPVTPAGAPAPAAAAPRLGRAATPAPLPPDRDWSMPIIGGAAIMVVLAILLFGWKEWGWFVGDDGGTQVTTTSTATPASGDDSESVSLLDDPRVVEIRERIESGEIKTVDDLRSAAEDAGFTRDEWDQLRDELSPNGQLVAPAPSSPGDGDTGKHSGDGGKASQNLKAGLSNKPTDLEALPRSTVKAAPLGQWFHPIYKSSTYQSSGGKDGQWSWAHTLFLGQATGGQFVHFEGNDGSFNFRHSDVHADVSFAVLTTSKWKSQFMEGNSTAPFGLNVRALPGTMITVYGENGKVLGSQAASRAGDLTIILPDDGVTGVSLSEDDPPKTFEVKVWVGPYDRSEGINTFDARSQAVSR